MSAFQVRWLRLHAFHRLDDGRTGQAAADFLLVECHYRRLHGLLELGDFTIGKLDDLNLFFF